MVGGGVGLFSMIARSRTHIPIPTHTTKHPKPQPCVTYRMTVRRRDTRAASEPFTASTCRSTEVARPPAPYSAGVALTTCSTEMRSAFCCCWLCGLCVGLRVGVVGGWWWREGERGEGEGQSGATKHTSSTQTTHAHRQIDTRIRAHTSAASSWKGTATKSMVGTSFTTCSSDSYNCRGSSFDPSLLPDGFCPSFGWVGVVGVGLGWGWWVKQRRNRAAALATAQHAQANATHGLFPRTRRR